MYARPIRRPVFISRRHSLHYMIRLQLVSRSGDRVLRDLASGLPIDKLSSLFRTRSYQLETAYWVGNRVTTAADATGSGLERNMQSYGTLLPMTETGNRFAPK